MLQQGCRIGVVGGGPAGSFFSYFLLDMAREIDVDLHLDVYEPRDFSKPGPTGCNMCGGIISESLVQTLAAEGIELGPEVIQRAIDSILFTWTSAMCASRHHVGRSALPPYIGAAGHAALNKRTAAGWMATF